MNHLRIDHLCGYTCRVGPPLVTNGSKRIGVWRDMGRDIETDSRMEMMLVEQVTFKWWLWIWHVPEEVKSLREGCPNIYWLMLISSVIASIYLGTFRTVRRLYLCRNCLHLGIKGHNFWMTNAEWHRIFRSWILFWLTRSAQILFYFE